MRSFTFTCIACLTLMVPPATPSFAQRPERPSGPDRPPRAERLDRQEPRDGNRAPDEFRRGRRPDGFRPPPNPVLQALDADGDRELSADEIANASVALKKLDKNNDGALTREELRPRPEMMREFDRGRGFGPPGDEGDFGFRGPPPEREGFENRPRGNRGRPDGPPGERRSEPGRGGFSPAKYVERIMQFDNNEDGKIEIDELPDRMRGMLEKGDDNRDGALSKDELLALAESADPRRPGSGFREGPPQGRRPPRPARPDIAD